MARIFRHSYTAVNKQTGRREQRPTKKWYIEYVDERGRMRRVPGFRDKIATQRKAVELEHAVNLAHRGERPAKTNADASRPLSEHLEEYAAHLAAKGDTDRHVSKTRARIKTLLAGVAAEFADELTQEKAECWLAGRRSADQFGAATSNHYARAAKGFSRWLFRKGRSPTDPLAGLDLLNADTDRRYVRRPLTFEEFAKLLAVTRRRPKLEGLTGGERALLYTVAAYTGLRRSELFSLTAASFALDATPPSVTVEARFSKRRRLDIVPVPDWLATELRPWLARRKSGFVWNPYYGCNTAEILAADLRAANIPVVDDRGRVVDFHALRMTYITNLARAGVPLVMAQRLARHSTPMLTSKHYVHVETGELAAEAAKLKPPK